MADGRWESREPATGQYSLTWTGKDGRMHSEEVVGIDLSSSGVGFLSPCELQTGAIVLVQAFDGSLDRECEVVHCAGQDGGFRIGCEFREAEAPKQTDPPAQQAEGEDDPDYYEILQISPKADAQTIHRVFRIMAARFHPDNPETGNVEQFLRMKRAYSVLSDPERRADYDAGREREANEPLPIFSHKAFVTGVEAEGNRRLGVLALLYKQRQTNPERPEVSLLNLESSMGFPREYLSFTMWYLRAKDYVNAADNADYVLTAAGADFLEHKAVRSDIVNQLLNPGTGRPYQEPGERKAARKKAGRTTRPILLPTTRALLDMR